jgi:hypothetical protein
MWVLVTQAGWDGAIKAQATFKEVVVVVQAAPDAM